MPATERLPRTLGPYRLQDRLGEGGMGVVHLAQAPDGGLVAVKVLNPRGDDVNGRRRLAREVETMRRVRSPYVAEVLDADVAGEFPYIVTRFVPGPTLEQLVRGRGPMSAAGLRRLACGTAEALAAIHAAGVVHRDLKPGNVMLAQDRPIVIDFGIAQAGDATRLTQTGLVMGTPGYLAPEVIEGQPSSPASDVHCWGATMAFAATGHLPFGGGSYESIFYRIVSGRADLEGVPAPLVPLISAALARDPAHRPSASWLSAQASALEPLPDGSRPTAVNTGSPFPATGNAAPAIAKKSRKPARPPWPGDQLERYKRQREQWRQDQELANRANYPGQPPQQPQASQQATQQPQAPQQQAPQQQAWPPQASKRPQQSQAPWPPQGPQPQGSQARGQFGPAAKPPARPNTMAGLAVMVAAVALTVVLPVAGLVVSLAVITLLRAADRAQAALAVRRSVRGPRASDLLLVLITAPLTVARAVLVEALMAPLALIAAAVVYGGTVVVTHSTNMPRAGAYAAAAVVAWYGIGPGSGKPRRQLNRMAGVLARNRMSTAVTALAVWGLAAAAVLFASSQTPYYWPAVAPHLPGLHSLITSAASWLLKHTRA
jgi:serine/threonine protein kinase